ncbi:MAG: hypothetical protein Q3965_02525 [Rothia sp. (in: high G+C Gram-positive bacteria)]|nr:hypothetical protein [Rothia sp. (in: high G+C Gram-positive bacteria)]
MQSQLKNIPGSFTAEGGRQLFLSDRPGLCASGLYPLALLLLFALGQPVALWLLSVAGLLEHGVRYPRTFDVFYPLHFYGSAALVLLLPTLNLLQTLSTGVAVSPP